MFDKWLRKTNMLQIACDHCKKVIRPGQEYISVRQDSLRSAAVQPVPTPQGPRSPLDLLSEVMRNELQDRTQMEGRPMPPRVIQLKSASDGLYSVGARKSQIERFSIDACSVQCLLGSIETLIRLSFPTFERPAIAGGRREMGA